MSLTGANGGYTLPTLLDPTLIHTGTASKNPIRDIARVVRARRTCGTASRRQRHDLLGLRHGALTDGSPTLAQPVGHRRQADRLRDRVLRDLRGLQPAVAAPRPDRRGVLLRRVRPRSSAVRAPTAPKGIVTAISATAGSTVTATTRGAFTTASAVDVFALLKSLPSRYEDSRPGSRTRRRSTPSSRCRPARRVRTSGPTSTTGIGCSRSSAPRSRRRRTWRRRPPRARSCILGDFSQYVIYDRHRHAGRVRAERGRRLGLPTGQRGLIAHKRVGVGRAPTSTRSGSSRPDRSQQQPA
jgi:hypothetical protein